MFGKDEDPGRPPESGDDAEVDEQAAGAGGEGARNAQATPKLAPSGNPGQTSHPAPPDDVGVPPDEELGEEKADD
ncbi:MAG TPA: hypothetical protein VGO29_12670 [Solirubrobacteraceae bacterium]|jgi:hypothetical protein|nr:hypothetical protein [Solirubrobacteraceae bacterium]